MQIKISQNLQTERLPLIGKRVHRMCDRATKDRPDSRRGHPLRRTQANREPKRSPKPSRSPRRTSRRQPWDSLLTTLGRVLRSDPLLRG